MRRTFLTFIAIALGTVCCTTDLDIYRDDPGYAQGSGESSEDESLTVDDSIPGWDGVLANDAADDVVGDDEDFYWEANDFSTKVTIIYDGSSATVESDSEKILYDVQGAYVTIDMQTNSVKNVEIEISGTSDDGGLKIYGEKKFKLTLAGVDLTSRTGPAINSQCKKRIFVHLEDGTVNALSDPASYSDDAYYLDGATADDEDRKGCFFSEGNLVFSGTGALVVEGNYKHGIVTDGYFTMRPGVTIAITGAAKNALHVKGDEDDGIGIRIDGGRLYASVSSTAGKGMKTDLDVEITGGQVELYTSGGSEYDEDDNDTSSAACIKADGDVRISGGTIVLKSTGTGGKGINADGSLTVDGGSIDVITTGGKYIYNEALDLTSSPKGVKADGDIVINGGEINITVSGESESSEGLESKSSITVNDGDIIIYAYDDAMNASTGITFNGGRTFCYSVNNDGIDSNGTLTVTGGLVIASGTTTPEEGFDCDDSSMFKVSGGTLIGTGGTATSPSSSSSQRTVIYNGISATKDQLLYICDSSGSPILAYTLPRTMSGLSLFFSSPELAEGSYTMYTGGTANGSEWNGWYSDATVSGGSSLGSFTVSGTNTTVGNSGGPGGGSGNPGGPGSGGRW